MSIKDYGKYCEDVAKDLLKENRKQLEANLSELMEVVYDEATDSHRDTDMAGSFEEMFSDTLLNWQNKTKDQTPEFIKGFTKATILQLQEIAGTAGMYCLPNDTDLQEAADFFENNYQRYQPDQLIEETKQLYWKETLVWRLSMYQPITK